MKTLSKNYKGATCKVCGVPVTYRSKFGHCKKHRKHNGWSQASKEAFSKKQMGENNTAWKGDSVSLCGLHMWISRNYGSAKTHKCECGEQGRDWACITGNYNRDMINWKPMCRSCHLTHDYKVGMR